MVTFPSATGSGAVGFDLVPWRAEVGDVEMESSTEEVRTVVELVKEHAESKPDESLIVITMGIKHANRIDAALKKLNFDPRYKAFFDADKQEKFDVKNLERVQGDERDAIILSVGYSKDRGGKLPYRFGPSNAQTAGNVASM